MTADVAFADDFQGALEGLGVPFRGFTAREEVGRTDEACLTGVGFEKWGDGGDIVRGCRGEAFVHEDDDARGVTGFCREKFSQQGIVGAKNAVCASETMRVSHTECGV